MRYLIILAALAVSAPAWGQPLTTDTQAILCMGYDPCHNLAAERAQAAAQASQPIATPDELKAAAESVQGTADELHITSQEGDAFIGLCAGWTNQGSRNLLIGNYTAAPTPTTSGFVNIGNRLCFWRDTGERAICPPPEPECAPDHQKVP